MIKVDGGFVKVVNVLTTFSDKEVEVTTYVKLYYADYKAEVALKQELKKRGYYTTSGEDAMYKKTILDPFEMVDIPVAKEENPWL